MEYIVAIIINNKKIIYLLFFALAIMLVNFRSKKIKDEKMRRDFSSRAGGVVVLVGIIGMFFI
jgi:hypothetical protein